MAVVIRKGAEDTRMTMNGVSFRRGSVCHVKTVDVGAA